LVTEGAGAEKKTVRSIVATWEAMGVKNVTFHDFSEVAALQN